MYFNITLQATKPQAIETTNIIATLYSKARATTLTGYKFTATIHNESFYQSNIESFLHHSPENCKNELHRLKTISNRDANTKLVNFQVFPDSAH